MNKKSNSGGNFGRPQINSSIATTYYDLRDDVAYEERDLSPRISSHDNNQAPAISSKFIIGRHPFRLLAFLAIVLRWYYIEISMQYPADNNTLSPDENI